MKTQHEIIMSALSHAINWELGYMDSIKHCISDPDYKESYDKCAQNVADYRKLLKKMKEKK